MFKHRDNIQYNPTTIDPSGVGQTLTTVPAPAPFGGQFGDAPAAPAAAAAAPTAAGRKRPRDVRGIDRFRQVVFGEHGFPRLHGMVSRTPLLMYPPDGIDAARRRLAKQETLKAKKAAEALADEEMWGLFNERRQAEAEADGTADASTNVAESDEIMSSEDVARDMALALHHHKQLDALLKLFYEFNHTTFVKLPVNDTLQLISRCGKEAVAHVMEYEMHARLSREAMLKELRALHDEASQLQRRRTEMAEAEEARALREAERVDDDMTAFMMEMANEELAAAMKEKDALDSRLLIDDDKRKEQDEQDDVEETLEIVELASSSDVPPRRSVHFAEAEADGDVAVAVVDTAETASASVATEAVLDATIAEDSAPPPPPPTDATASAEEPDTA